MAEDVVLKMLQEMRAETKESRDETRDNFGKVFRRLAVVEAEAKDFRGETSDNFGKVFHRLAVLESQIDAGNERTHR